MRWVGVGDIEYSYTYTYGNLSQLNINTLSAIRMS